MEFEIFHVNGWPKMWMTQQPHHGQIKLNFYRVKSIPYEQSSSSTEGGDDARTTASHFIRPSIVHLHSSSIILPSNSFGNRSSWLCDNNGSRAEITSS